MCGIIGIICEHNENVVTKILDGLGKLEYRGYDSAGFAVIQKGKIVCEKAVGKLENLTSCIATSDTGTMCVDSNIGIGHTRWATHGKATKNNAHPIISKNVALVHNGIIENYNELKFDLQKDGYQFVTETDTEAVVHLIQRELDRGFAYREAFHNSLKLVDGSYAFAAIFADAPDVIVAARLRSPLAVGFGKNAMCVGSDESAISALCTDVSYLEDGDCIEITKTDAIFFDKSFKRTKRNRQAISNDVINFGKGEYAHYMLKEIMEQPSAMRKTILHNKIDPNMLEASKILILACGTSYYAGIVAKYWFEKFLKIPTCVEIASEYRYRSPVIEKDTTVIVITQSGETIDTLEAMEYVKKNSNSKVIAIANVKNSAVARFADIVFYTEAGLEIGVASTKAFSSQLALLSLIAFSKNEYMLQKLQTIPCICEDVIEMRLAIKDISEKIKDAKSVIFLGRDSLYPIALEGALKLKEISYIHAEGFAAGEMKHGPVALIDDLTPVVCLCPHNELFDKMLSNIQVVLARGKNVMVFTDAEGAKLMPKGVVTVIMPQVQGEFAPILYVIPLQFLAYYTALALNADVDKPRNLAKSVTVE